MECIVNKEQSTLIWRAAHLHLLSSLYAVYNGHYLVSLFPGIIYLSSIAYWYKPDYSWRLYLDLVIVRSAILTHNILIYNAERANIYYTVFLTGGALYPVGRYYFNRGDYWKYVYIHVILYFIANAANIYLYSGKL
jgi:hypothetical protein